jgi:hypothetical protein
VTLEVDTNNSQNVTVALDGPVVGQVVLYANYASTNGNLVFSKPIIVYSSPAGTVLTAIAVSPTATALSVGDAVSLDIWGLYTNGASSLLYVPLSQPAIFSSSNTAAVSVDTNGLVTAQNYGSSVISVSYQGFSTQATIGVLPPTGQPFLQLPSFVTNGVVSLEVVAQPGGSFGIEISTNLVDWTWLDYLFTTNVISEYLDGGATNNGQRFYRLQGF